MINIYKSALKISKENILLTTQLVLLIILLQFISVLALVKGATNLIVLLTSSTSLFLLAIAFLSGWLAMVQTAIENSKRKYQDELERRIASAALYKTFFVGVGEFFVSNLLLTLACIFLFAFIMFVLVKLLLVFKPTLALSFHEFAEISKSFLSMTKFSLSDLSHQMKIFLFWSSIFNFLNWVFSYIMMFSLAFVYKNKSKNPIKAISSILRFLLKNLINTLILFSFLTVVYFVVFTVAFAFSANIILNIIALFLMGFYITFYTISVFLFYEKKAEDNCNSRCDGDREN